MTGNGHGEKNSAHLQGRAAEQKGNESHSAASQAGAPAWAVVALVPDLFFAARISDVITAQGGRPVVVETPAAFVDALDAHFPVLALLDLGAGGDWESAIVRCKSRPHTKQIPLVAFGSHVDVETLQAARRAGADHAWARSKFTTDLVDLVARHLHPSVRYVAGWDAPMSDKARQGLLEFNAGEYFEQHEYFEEAWIEESRPIRELYQGILQVGVAFLQIERGNWAGALKMFRRGLPRLRSLPPDSQGIDLAAFRATAEAIHLEVTELGPERLHEFDRNRFPRLRLIENWQPVWPEEAADGR